MRKRSIKTGVSLPEDVIALINEYMEKSGVRSRSKILAEAVRSFIAERAWIEEPEKTIIGALVVVYNEKRGETVKKLLDIQHDFIGGIIATLHLHITHDRCLEVILVKSKAEKIGQLMAGMESIVGVELVKLIPIIIG